MKREYIFVGLIIIMLYMTYVIMNYKYKEYRINSHIELLATLNEDISTSIDRAEKIIDYKSTKAYRNKVLKDEQWLKNKGENVVFLIDEVQYNKYTSQALDILSQASAELPEGENILNTMNIRQKWIYFISKKDTR